MTAASTPSKAPLRARISLQVEFSSAGVVWRTTRPGSPPSSSRSMAASARKAPTAWAHMTLWPQPCPMPGRASYSQRMATAGARASSIAPTSARRAVARSKTPSSWSMPWLSRRAPTAAMA